MRVGRFTGEMIDPSARAVDVYTLAARSARRLALLVSQGGKRRLPTVVEGFKS
jgi:hypothetical protein